MLFLRSTSPGFFMPKSFPQLRSLSVSTHFAVFNFSHSTRRCQERENAAWYVACGTPLLRRAESCLPDNRECPTHVLWKIPHMFIVKVDSELMLVPRHSAEKHVGILLAMETFKSLHTLIELCHHVCNDAHARHVRGWCWVHPELLGFLH